MTQTGRLDWILRRVRLSDDRPLHDVAIGDGVFQAVNTHVEKNAARELDLAGRVLLPGLVDVHVHLDKTFSDTTNLSGTLSEAIERFAAIKRSRTLNDVYERATRALDAAAEHGVTMMRSHVDVANEADLDVVAALADLRRRYVDRIDLELVALTRTDGSTVSHGLLAAARDRGIDLIGGAPALSADPRRSIDGAFDLAAAFDCGLDLHIDETDDPGCRTLEHLAETTLTRGMAGRVTAGHCCSLAFMNEVDAGRILDKVARADLHLVTLPVCNLVLIGRGSWPQARGALPVKHALARGVRVSAASDNVQDPFNPFGGYDPLGIASVAAQVAQLTSPQEMAAAIDMVTATPARAMGRTAHRIEPGSPADCVIVDAKSLAAVLAYPPARLGTFKRGRFFPAHTLEPGLPPGLSRPLLPSGTAS